MLFSSALVFPVAVLTNPFGDANLNPLVYSPRFTIAIRRFYYICMCVSALETSNAEKVVYYFGFCTVLLIGGGRGSLAVRRV